MPCIYTVCVFNYPVPSPIRIFLWKTDVCGYARSDCIRHRFCPDILLRFCRQFPLFQFFDILPKELPAGSVWAYPGAGLSGSIGSKCDLCAYMAGKNHFCTHCRTPSGLLLTFRMTRTRVRLSPFRVTCQRHFLLRQHSNNQDPKKVIG